jgi:hypothetical protein
LFTTVRYDKDGDQQSLLFGVCFPSARSSSVSFFGAHHFVEWQVSAPETSRHTARSASASREPIRILDRPFGRPLKIPVINQVYFGPLEFLEIS